jgi:trimeric autotransporter adhesin
MCKIVVLSFGLPPYEPPPPPAPTPTPTFLDVGPDNAFYPYVESAARHRIVNGYSDGTFRPGINITRGQLSKIVVITATLINGWPVINPPTPSFTDVSRDDGFYVFVETAVCHGIVAGYSDGTFRPGNTATRAQISKIVCLAVRNEGQCGVSP